jgi:hypothetical protein
MVKESALLYVLIVGCEIAFWLVLLLSLVFRYLLRKQMLSKWLLWSLPLIDLLLLGFTALDLRSGTTATFAHGLAAAYLGFTVAFGSTVIKWADERFAHRYAAGPKPKLLPTTGWEVVRFDLKLWLRCIVACIIALALLELIIAFVANDTATQPLLIWYKHAFGCVFFWFIFGPTWSLLFSRRGAQ